MSTTTPYALFMGDFNVGKSSLVNALVRREALVVSRRETRAVTTYVSRGASDEPFYGGWPGAAGAIDALGHEEYLATRLDLNPKGYTALSARLPELPFARLALVDTVGISSEIKATARINALDDLSRALMLVVTDIEYWSARHTMEFIEHHRRLMGDSLIVVANKADHLNASEIQRLCDKAHTRLEAFGIKPAPRFFAVSARLEAARYQPGNEYRQRTKRDVRDRCDAGMDALRVALYEFEARHTEPAAAEALAVINSPLSLSFLKAFEGPSA